MKKYIKLRQVKPFTNQKKMANTIAELVFIPAPGMGHIMSTVEIAKLLVQRDQRLSITVLVIIGSGSAISMYVESLTNKAMDRIRFVVLPHDETPPKAPMTLTFLIDFINSHCKYVRNVVTDMMNQPGFGQVAGFVVDVFCADMIDVANELDVPTYLFFTSNAAFLRFNLYIHTLCDSQNQDVTEFISNSDAEIPTPSFVNRMPTKVFPALFQTKDGFDFLRYSVQKMKEVKAIMVNTFLELETHAIESFLSLDNSFPPVYPVGPILNLDGVAGKPQDSDVISWLDNQPQSSVVFLCFGSMGYFDEIQVKEIAHALESSGHRFVWSLHRPPSSEQMMNVGDYEDPGVVLPEGFLERTRGVGKVIGWAPQATLLAHRAIGGFVSHCGWNSVLESFWFGVPLATWPLYSEQQFNAFELVVELGLAVEIKLDYKKDVMFNSISDCDTIIVTAEEIENGIRQLMDNMEVKEKVKEMSRKSRAAVTMNGSSFTSIDRLIHEFINNIS